MNASFNPNTSYGRALLDLAGSVVPAFGDVHVVVSSSDSSDPNFQKLQDVFKPSNGYVRFWTSLSDAYDACTTNNNDVILLDAHTTHTITPFVWSKNRINVIGMDGGGRLRDMGAKVGNSAADTAAYVIKVTGTRNSFRNVKFLQNSTQATGLHVIEDGGAQTLYKNCQFAFGVATNLGLTTAHEFIAGSDTNTFEDCTFGSDTVLTSAARSVFHIDQVTTSQEFKSNILKNCNFIISSTDAGAQFVKMDSNADALFTNLFDDCSFQASLDSAGGIALTRAVSTANGFVKGTLNFSFPRVFGCTDFGTNGTNNDNLFVVAPLVSNTDIVGTQPIAT